MLKINNRAYIFVVSFLLLIASSKSFSQWYVGVDKTNMEWHVNGLSRQFNYDLDPTRFKIGVSERNYSLELQYYGNDNDDSPATTLGGVPVTVNSGIENAFGVFAKAASTGRFGYYGQMGMVIVNSRLEIPGLTTDRADFESFAIGAGLHYKVTDNFELNLDYVEMEGDVNYPNYVAQTPGGGALDAQLKGWSVGARYSF